MEDANGRAATCGRAVACGRMKVRGDSEEKVVLECSWKILGIFLECSWGTTAAKS